MHIKEPLLLIEKIETCTCVYVYLPLAYVSVYQRMSENFIRNSYVSLIHNSVTGPLSKVNDNFN